MTKNFFRMDDVLEYVRAHPDCSLTEMARGVPDVKDYEVDGMKGRISVKLKRLEKGGDIVCTKVGRTNRYHCVNGVVE